MMGHMKDGNKAQSTLKNVVPYKSITYHGSVLFGLLQFEGAILLDESKATEKGSTLITCSFETTGLIGFLVATFKPSIIKEGTADGLENMIRLSEEAEKANS